MGKGRGTPEKTKAKPGSSGILCWMFVLFLSAGVAITGVFFQEEAQALSAQVYVDHVEPQIIALKKMFEDPKEQEEAERQKRAAEAEVERLKKEEASRKEEELRL